MIKKIYSIFLFLLFITPLQAQIVPGNLSVDTEYYDTGEKKKERTYDRSTGDKRVVTYYKNGQISSEYKSNWGEGRDEEKTYNENGQLWRKGKWNDGQEVYSEEYIYTHDMFTQGNPDEANLLTKKKVYNAETEGGPTQTITTFYANGNIQTQAMYKSSSPELPLVLSEYEEYTEDGRKYSFVFVPQAPLESCPWGTKGSLGESWCGPYEKYLDGKLISSMDKDWVYKKFDAQGKIIEKCNNEEFKTSQDWHGQKDIKCVFYSYAKDGSLQKEEESLDGSIFREY